MTELSPMMKAFRGVCKTVGVSLRSMGRSFDDLGARMQGPFAAYETLSRHQQFMTTMNKTPEIGDKVFVAPNASLIGAVSVGSLSSIWYGAILRGDVNKITIGERTNVQDRAMIHVSSTPKSLPTVIGSGVSIGHRAVVHAATIEDEAFIGMGAVVMDGSVIQKHAYIAPGSLIPPNSVVKSGELWAGSPAKMVRNLTDDEKEKIVSSAKDYLLIAEAHLFETTKDYDRIEFDRLKRKIMTARSVEFQQYMKSVGREQEQSEMQARMDLETRRRHWGG